MSLKTPISVLANKVREKGLIPLFLDFEEKELDYEALEVVCKVHGKYTTKARLINRGNGCLKCAGVERGKRRRFTLESVKDAAEILGLKLVSPSFVSESGPQILKFACNIHGEFEQDHLVIIRGRGCPRCGHESGGAKNTKSTCEFKDEVAHTGYELVSEYVNSSTKIQMKCQIHGVFEILPSDLLGGHKCQKCSLSYSGPQSELYGFVKGLCPDAVVNTRIVIRPMELDIYIPSLSLAIEYCGLYWHSEEKKGKKYHLEKLKKCNASGIRLITVFEDEWLKRKDQVKNFILSSLGKNDIKLQARKCKIGTPTKKEARDFLEENHIQGAAQFTVGFGLYHDGLLVGVITGNRHHRGINNADLVLNRLAFASRVSIAGGSSKLLKSLVSYAKANGYSKIISWSDNRWSEGNVYLKMGFTRSEDLGPDYSYFKKQSRVSKQSCQKKRLMRLTEVHSTEAEMAKSLGYGRIWDCGKIRWQLLI